MKRTVLLRLTALMVCLCLLLTGAQALTAKQTVELLEKYYVDPIPPAVYQQDTVEGVLAALGDPYTTYFTAEEYARFTNSMRDTVIVGIGVSVRKDERGLLLDEALEGGPAKAGGILAGDIITAVDGSSVVGLSLDEASGLLRGEEGTKVTVSVLRGDVELTFSLTRRRVVVPATTTKLVDGRIGYIECTTFGQETTGHFEDGLAQYRDSADHWIVDLRGNGGGVVSDSVNAAGCFAGAGWLAYLRTGDGRYYYYERAEVASTDKPVIVLVDQDTASASELFASAIRDTQRGLIIGSRTYGKGVAQYLLDANEEPECFQDGDALKITVYRYYSANLVSGDHVGVIPDLLVSEENAETIAMLLCAPHPEENTRGYLWLDLKGDWFIDLDMATGEDCRAAFTELLEAVPPGAGLYYGVGSSQWVQFAPQSLAAFCGLTEYTSRGFTDIHESPYAYEITSLGAYRVINGYGGGIYNPKGNLTRGELCEMLVKAIRYPTNVAACPFEDVRQGKDWFARSVNAMYATGLVNGVSAKAFYPNAGLTHRELITILGRVAGQLSADLDDALANAPESYDGQITAYPGWARPYVWLLAESQKDAVRNTVSLLWDDLENIDPMALTTREEAAALLYNVLGYIGILNE